MQQQLIKTSQLEPNTGQIEGLPKNPRFIKDEKYKSLVKSLTEDPDMLELRELIVYPFNDSYVVIGGNMRLRAGQELGFKEMPCKVLTEDTTLDKLKRLTIKDNGSWGSHDWEQLANEWDSEPLNDWGVDMPDYGNTNMLETVNQGDENDEWVGMPEFEAGEKDIKVIIYFESERERETYCEDKEIEITRKQNNQWISRL